jgi:hypothetical protein
MRKTAQPLKKKKGSQRNKGAKRRVTDRIPVAWDSELSSELEKHRRQVSYDSYDILIRQLVDLVAEKSIDIAPEYQRQFVWNDESQSKLIESIFLGIPIPSLFMATNRDSTWEVIDGVQRISTVIRFCGSKDQLTLIGRDHLKIKGLEKLLSLNGHTFETLPKSLQLAFQLKSLKVTTLNDKSDLDVRFDLFERLNTGGVTLQPQEIRACIFQGPFNDFLRALSVDENFRKVVKLQQGNQHNATYEEFVLRFFAFLHAYKTFDHDVREFLNNFMKRATTSFDKPADTKIFKRTFEILGQNLPNGVVRLPRRITPVNLFEGIAVGTALALQAADNIKANKLPKILVDEKLRKFTTAATNSQKMVAGRIEHVRDQLISA